MKALNHLLGLCLWSVLLISCAPPEPQSLEHSSYLRNRVLVSGLEILPHNKDSSQPPSARPTVILTLTDSETGAVKHVSHIVGEGNLDLSGVPDGVYSLLVETSANGFRPPAPQSIIIKNGRLDNLQLNFERIEHNNFYYYWESDHEGREFEYSVNENVSPKIEFLDESIEIPLTTAAQTLRSQYNIALSNTDETQWSYNLSSKLLKAVNSLPHSKLSKVAKFTLTSKELLNDIKFSEQNGHYNVEINLNAFAFASEKLVKLNDQRGVFFSQRLFHALVVFFTNNGKKSSAVSKILHEKFGVTTSVSNYRALTATDEPASHFQDFKPNELVKIINAFAEMPQGFYKIPGLRYLLRRLDGHPHPLYPNAAAVAWPRGAQSDSYIEFMDTAFISQSESGTHRLILHEKSHFLWSNVFSQELREGWIAVGNWFENPQATSGWSTSDTTAFVSPYAHNINPNEDMAESIANYVLNPNKVLSRAEKKFKFIEKRIMNGYRYVSTIREDLTFEVLNLFPDYDYPGKIRRVEVKTDGDPTEDKRVTVTIELTDKPGIEDDARSAYTRITSPNQTFKDLRLHPVNGNGHLLRGSLTIPNTAKSGYWTIQNISVTDQTGLERHEGIIDFGFKLYINNAVEDITPPRYVADTMTIISNERQREERQVFEIDVSWEIDEDLAMAASSPVYANMISLDHSHLYRITSYGNFNDETNIGKVRLVLTEHHPPGRYGISFVNMRDRALNRGDQRFSDDPQHEEIRYVTINSRDPDYDKPVLDPEKITVEADPENPEAPDGRTNVRIVFYAKDNKSGLGLVSYTLVDPLGNPDSHWFYHSNTYTRFYQGDPTVYKRYEIRKTLPKGSAPGTWGVSEIVLRDKAGNTNTYDFLETLHFRLEE